MALSDNKYTQKINRVVSRLISRLRYIFLLEITKYLRRVFRRIPVVLGKLPGKSIGIFIAKLYRHILDR